MKKVMTFILMIIIISTTTVNFAVNDDTNTGEDSNKSYSIGLSTQDEEIKQGEEIEIILTVKDIKNILGIWGWTAQLNYDTDVFETIEVDPTFNSSDNLIGIGGSGTPIYNSENNQIASEGQISTTVKDGEDTKIVDVDILKIKLKVKSDATIDTNAEVSITNFALSEGDYDITSSNDAKISLKVTNQNTNNDDENNDNNNDNDNNNSDNNDNNNNNDNGNNSNNNNNNGNTENDDSNNNEGNSNSENNAQNPQYSNTSLPYAGRAEVILIASAIVIIIGVLSYIRYKRTY